MKFLVNCEAFDNDGSIRAELVMVDATCSNTALSAAKAHMRTWPECANPEAGIMVASPRPVFLSIGHAITYFLTVDLAYLIHYMVVDGDDAMELSYAAGYVACALFGGVDEQVDWFATQRVIEPRVAAAMLRMAGAKRAALVPEELLS